MSREKRGSADKAPPAKKKWRTQSVDEQLVQRIERLIDAKAVPFTSVAAYLAAKVEPHVREDEQHFIQLAEAIRTIDARGSLERPWREPKA